MTIFLSESEVKDLKVQHKSEKNGRKRDRIKAVLLSSKGWTYRQISEALLIDEETVSRHVVEYQISQKLNLDIPGRSEKLSKAEALDLEGHLDKMTYTSVQEICVYVFKTYQISYTVPGMTFWLHRHGFSFKKPKPTPYKADPVKQELFIEKYLKILETLPKDEPLEFCDATHPTMETKITYGWIRKGTEKIIGTTASRSRCNILASINLHTMEVTYGEHDTINSEAIEQHFRKLRQKYFNAPWIHLIVDQGSYNKSAATLRAAEKFKIKLHLLPTYSPNLNPIERLWKVMNERVRNNVFFRSAKEFRQSIHNFFEITWQKIAHSMKSRINDNFQLLKIPISN